MNKKVRQTLKKNKLLKAFWEFIGIALFHMDMGHACVYRVYSLWHNCQLIPGVKAIAWRRQIPLPERV
jgi:hypothetical protein